ncbi:Os07g0609700 [Oryza sativa Japonica Group]|uniref:DC1 domain-containing protein n=3 Tax=Oryza sativa TaxID=4530 RepID=A3BM30_ORYSJ|nr:Hypothetical protein [Oryza sativa]EAZ40619.1 hypothetical protein OsJ_25083 [Oryza sativa Japonica Group]BAC84650.1 hypothetical protein [Oryza sativa Japonica Group]BAT02599.1 Os07g0609700 [Oryza sativa Japonica Group]
MAGVSCFYHPEHLVTEHHYGEGSGSGSGNPCAACERVVTGDGYRCEHGECDFHVHRSCLALPASFALHERHEHELTLTRLTGSRWCNVCDVISHAGCRMYACAPCNFSAHPRCTPVLDGAHQQPQPPQQQEGEEKRSVGVRAAKVALKIGVAVGLTAVDVGTTGGLATVGSLVIAPIVRRAIDKI